MAGFGERLASAKGLSLHNELTGLFEQDEDWVIGYCPEVPGANGQGRHGQVCSLGGKLLHSKDRVTRLQGKTNPAALRAPGTVVLGQPCKADPTQGKPPFAGFWALRKDST